MIITLRTTLVMVKVIIDNINNDNDYNDNITDDK